MHRFLAIGVAGVLSLVLCGAATAWSWPADGAVLRPFLLGTDGYAGGQHRGIDVAGADGTPVRAPAAGVVTFAGSLPTYGRGVSILTADGYSVTLVHLGAISVAKGDTVAEGSPVGTMGTSGTPEQAVPSVHLGIRRASEEQGYVDPLGLLPPRPAPPPPAPVADPAPSPVVVAPPAPVAAPPAPPPAVTAPPSVTPPAPVTPPAASPTPAAPVASAPPAPVSAASPAAPEAAVALADADAEALSVPAEAPQPFVVSSSAAMSGSRPVGAHHPAGQHGHPARAVGAAGDGAHVARTGHAAHAPDTAGGDSLVSRASPRPAAPAASPPRRSADGRTVDALRVGSAPARTVSTAATRSVPHAAVSPHVAASEVRPRDAVPHGAARRATGMSNGNASRRVSVGTGAGAVPTTATPPRPDAVGRGHDGGPGLPARPAAIALAMLLAAMAARRVARRIVRDGAVLHHHADLLRQLDAAHRPRLHDRGRGRVRTPSAAART